MVTPTITYASLVWWPKTQQSTAMNMLQKVQSAACMEATGIMSSSLTAVLEVLLSVPPLRGHIKRIALQSTLQIQTAGHYKPGDLTRHIQVLDESASI